MISCRLRCRPGKWKGRIVDAARAHNRRRKCRRISLEEVGRGNPESRGRTHKRPRLWCRWNFISSRRRLADEAYCPRESKLSAFSWQRQTYSSGVASAVVANTKVDASFRVALRTPLDVVEFKIRPGTKQFNAGEKISGKFRTCRRWNARMPLWTNKFLRLFTFT